MLIVVTLVVILASIGMATYTNSVHRAREAVLKEDLFRMRDAIDQYYADKNKYPQALQDLVTDGYLREIPKDPMTDSAETWNDGPAEPDPNNPAAEPGIYDVKSGSRRPPSTAPATQTGIGSKSGRVRVIVRVQTDPTSVIERSMIWPSGECGLRADDRQINDRQIMDQRDASER